MEKNKKKAAGGDVRGRGVLRKIFEFYVLLATQFSLRPWLVRRRGGRVMLLRALQCLWR